MVTNSIGDQYVLFTSPFSPISSIVYARGRPGTECHNLLGRHQRLRAWEPVEEGRQSPAGNAKGRHPTRDDHLQLCHQCLREKRAVVRFQTIRIRTASTLWLQYSVYFFTQNPIQNMKSTKNRVHLSCRSWRAGRILLNTLIKGCCPCVI